MSDAALKRYIDVFERLGPETLNLLDEVMSEHVHFVDPFNDINGRDKVEKIFQHMFASLDQAVFRVSYSAIDSETGERGLIRWRLTSTLNGKPYVVEGMSDVGFDADGKVNEHIDHWDAAGQFYSRIPVIGWLLGLIRGRLSV